MIRWAAVLPSPARAWLPLSIAVMAASGMNAARTASAAEPPARSSAEAALLADLEKMVESEQSLGWTVDRYEIDEMMPTALLSVCEATEETRAAALAHLDAQIAALGGPVEEAYERSGRDLDAIEELLFATRVRALLDEAALRAARPGGECPFWIQPSESFQGRQSDAYRFTLHLEGGGLLLLHRSEGKIRPGGGGAGRVLLGYGVDRSWTAMAGVELGGHAQFEQTATETHFPISFVGALPLVLRHHSRTWHYDAELAGIGYFTQADTRVSPGLRGGALIGFSGLRLRSIMPWAGVGIAFEYVIATSFRDAAWTLRAGARVGFDIDP